MMRVVGLLLVMLLLHGGAVQAQNNTQKVDAAHSLVGPLQPLLRPGPDVPVFSQAWKDALEVWPILYSYRMQSQLPFPDDTLRMLQRRLVAWGESGARERAFSLHGIGRLFHTRHKPYGEPQQIAAGDSAAAYYLAAMREFSALGDTTAAARAISGVLNVRSAARYQMLPQLRELQASICDVSGELATLADMSNDTALLRLGLGGVPRLYGEITDPRADGYDDVVYGLRDLALGKAASFAFARALENDSVDFPPAFRGALLALHARALANDAAPDSARKILAQAWPLIRDAADSTIAWEAQAAILRLAGNDSAIAMQKQVVARYRAASAWFDVARAQQMLGDMLRELGQPGGAVLAYREAQAGWRAQRNCAEEARALSGVGGAYWQLGQPDSARLMFEHALPLWARQSDVRGYADAANALAELALARMDLAEAARHIKYATELEHVYEAGTLRTHNNLTLLAYLSGDADYAAAIVHNGVGDSPEAAVARTAAALAAIARDKPIDALWKLSDAAGQPPVDRMLSDQEDWPLAGRLRNHPMLTGWYHLAAGAALVAHGDLDRAVRALTQAQPALASIGDSTGIAMVSAYLARAYMEIGAQQVAEEHLARAGRYGEQVGITRSAPKIPTVKAALAKLKEVQSDRWSLADYAQGSEIENTSNRLSLETRDNPLPLAQAYADVAVAYRSANRPNHELAAAYYDSASISFMRVDLHFADDDVRIAYADRLMALGEAAATLWLAREREVGPRIAALGALGAIERGRSLAFQHLSLPAKTDSSALISRYRHYQPPTSDVAGRVEYFGELPSPAAAERALDEADFRGMALIYFLTGDTLITWVTRSGDVLTPQQVTMFRKAVPLTQLSGLIVTLRGSLDVDSAARSLENPDPLARLLARGTDWEQALQQVADVVLPAEVRALLPDSGEVLIVPHGPIAQVPFAALPLGDRKILASDRLQLSYAPSLATLYIAQHNAPGMPRAYSFDDKDSVQIARARWTENALVIGDPVMPTAINSKGETVTLKQLEGARAEAQTIASMLKVAPVPRERATESTFAERARNATVIHLATHGFVYGDPDEGANSFVALAPGPKDDGLLTVGELLDGEVTLEAADLVVLSACQTGLGHIAQSEGTLGLQRAFLARGARSVLVSLWSVDDRATGMLMASFYRHWIEDEDQPSKAEALRRAQNDLRKTYPNPRYWAAFQLFGAN